MPLIVTFGDIFRHKEQEFVYLAQNGDVVYAAKILDEEKTNQILKLEKRRIRNAKIKNHVLYSFVILSTDEFKNRMAHFNNTDKNNIEPTFDIIGLLNKKDMKEVKEEILYKNSAVPIRLKELIKDIDI